METGDHRLGTWVYLGRGCRQTWSPYILEILECWRGAGAGG